MNIPLKTFGFMYGLLLAMAGFAALGFGHGSLVVLGLVSSPFGVLDNALIALACTPILWMVIGGLLRNVDRRPFNLFFLAAMLLHYGALFFVLRGPSQFADSFSLKKVQGEVIGGFVFYGAGQIAIWIAYARLTIRRKRSEKGLCLNCGYDLRSHRDDRCPECGVKFELMEDEGF